MSHIQMSLQVDFQVTIQHVDRPKGNDFRIMEAQSIKLLNLHSDTVSNIIDKPIRLTRDNEFMFFRRSFFTMLHVNFVSGVFYAC